MDIPYKKILCTPESFHKKRKAAEELRINIYKEYFCLFDECEKVTQDIDYRRKIAQPIYDFFQFEGKAFVSATPLPMSHEEFERQNFQKIKIKPEYDYKKDLELIVTNSYYKRLKKVLNNMKDSKCVCIFFNVTDGINEIIENLGITDYKIFCSQKSVNKLINRGIDKAYSMIDYPLAKYNFFTCRFYSGLDIVLRKCKPDIIMLTDFSSANWTMIDPFTEAIQIQGRFRKTKKDDDVTYNSLTHISTINPNIEVMTKTGLTSYLEQSKRSYDKLRQDLQSDINEEERKSITKDLKNLEYSDLLDERGKVNSFSVDNLYNEERVKSYYVSAQALYQAYKDTEFFNVTLNDVTECVGDDDIRKLNTTKQAIERRKILVQLLDKIFNDFENGRITFKEKDDFINVLKGQSDALYTINAYMKIGKVGIENAQYQKGKIDKAINQYDKEQAEILRFSPEVKKAIYEEFEKNVYINKNELKNTLQAIYEEYGINLKVKQDTIKDYYDTDNSGSINGGSYKLTAFKFSLVDF